MHALILAVLAAAAPAPEMPAPRIRIPEWLQGRPICEAGLAVRPILLEFWATW